MSLMDANPVNPARPKRVAIVISNPAVSTTTGWPVGFWWSELTHPYFEFTERGYAVELFSPDGGRAEPDVPAALKVCYFSQREHRSSSTGPR